jgi:hypothetical protein
MKKLIIPALLTIIIVIQLQTQMIEFACWLAYWGLDDIPRIDYMERAKDGLPYKHLDSSIGWLIGIVVLFYTLIHGLLQQKASFPRWLLTMVLVAAFPLMVILIFRSDFKKSYSLAQKEWKGRFVVDARRHDPTFLWKSLAFGLSVASAGNWYLGRRRKRESEKAKVCPANGS